MVFLWLVCRECRDNVANCIGVVNGFTKEYTVCRDNFKLLQMARNPARQARTGSVELRFGIELGGGREAIRHQPSEGVADREIDRLTGCPSCGAASERRIYCQECLPIVRRIQGMVRTAVAAAGLRISKGTPCSRCKTAWALVLDHRHYSCPYDVQPVCRACNIALGPALDIGRLVRAWKKLCQ
jgi:hypothetical protein